MLNYAKICCPTVHVTLCLPDSTQLYISKISSHLSLKPSLASVTRQFVNTIAAHESGLSQSDIRSQMMNINAQPPLRPHT